MSGSPDGDSDSPEKVTDMICFIGALIDYWMSIEPRSATYGSQRVPRTHLCHITSPNHV
jgi:hypothetical protein